MCTDMLALYVKFVPPKNGSVELQIRGLGTYIQKIPSPTDILTPWSLALAYSEHLSPTHGARTLGSRFAILHLYVFGILHFPLGAALHAVRLHCLPPLFLITINDSFINVNSTKVTDTKEITMFSVTRVFFGEERTRTTYILWYMSLFAKRRYQLASLKNCQ
jgi:hypothetical protein